MVNSLIIEINMKSFIALLAIVGFAAAEIGFGPCPDFQGISDFQVGDYLGLWYEVERYEQEFQLNGECVTAQYSANDDGSVRVWNTLEVLAVAPGDENQLFSMEGRAVLADPLADPLVGALNVTFGGEPDVTNYHIIGTDYENFAVVFNCFEILPNITDSEY